MVHPDNGILLSAKKKTSYQAMKKQGVTSNTYYERNYSEKAINYKRLQSYMIPTIWHSGTHRTTDNEKMNG